MVSSPGKDLLITAVHCINGGKGSRGYNSDIVFIPGYRDGQEPFGAWTQKVRNPRSGPASRRRRSARRSGSTAAVSRSWTEIPPG